MDIYREIVRLREEGRRGALATIVNVRGSIPARDRFQTRNLRQMYQRLFNTSGGDPSIPRPYPVLPVTLSATTGLVTASMVPGTMSFYILDLTGSSSNVAIEFATPTGATFSATLAPQVSVYRLP